MLLLFSCSLCSVVIYSFYLYRHAIRVFDKVDKSLDDKIGRKKVILQCNSVLAAKRAFSQ